MNLRGVAHYSSGIPKAREGDLDSLVIEMRPALRRGLERSIVATLAGDLGAHILAPKDDVAGHFEGPSGDLEQAERIAELASLTGREEAALATTETEGVDRHDQDKAMHKAWLLAGAGLAERYVKLLEAVTVELVMTDRFGKLVRALVPPLLEHRVLSARAVRTVLCDADKEVTA